MKHRHKSDYIEAVSPICGRGGRICTGDHLNQQCLGKQGLTCAKRKHSYDIIAHELEKTRKQLSGSE